MRQEKRNELVLQNVKLAYAIANKFGVSGCVDHNDLRQIAVIGLIKAAEGFNPDMGAKFSTYACRVIHNELLSAATGNIFEATCDLEELHIEAHNLDMDELELFNDLRNILTDKEFILIVLLYSGYKQRKVATQLGISQSHVSRIYRRAKAKIIDYVHGRVI